MRICSQPPRHHPHRNSIQIHGLELMSLSVLYGSMDFASYGLSWELVSYMRLPSALYVHGSLSPLDCSMPIVQIDKLVDGAISETRVSSHRNSCFAQSSSRWKVAERQTPPAMRVMQPGRRLQQVRMNRDLRIRDIFW